MKHFFSRPLSMDSFADELLPPDYNNWECLGLAKFSVVQNSAVYTKAIYQTTG